MKSVTTNNCDKRVTLNNRNIHCEKCNYYFDDSEIVYRAIFTIKAGEACYPYIWLGWCHDGTEVKYDYYNQQFLYVCGECMKGRDLELLRTVRRDCDTCKRPVIYVGVISRYLHSFCSRFCEFDYYNEIQHQKRLAAREDITCNVCGGLFTPKRSGAITCSNKCRQKMYRVRHQNTEQATNRLVSA